MNDKPKTSKNNGNNRPKPMNNGRNVSRGAAMRAQQRNHGEAQRVIDSYDIADNNNSNNNQKRANQIDDSPRLKIIGLGGMDSAGSKNMILVEYLNDAVILDCGNNLGIDLPGINYAVCDTSYLETIKHKIRAYIITHGHLDHIGGLPHIVPRFPAPIYGSRFTIGMVEKVFENFGGGLPTGFSLQTVIMNESNHEKLKIGPFFVELVRITHSIPGSCCIVLDTPVGKILNTGDFRFDPNPLDHERSDIDRLRQLGDEGILALLSECTTTERLGRTPSESTIEPTYVDIFKQSSGRIFIALFSSNMNRIQMIVNAAVLHGRKVAFDGRSMMSTLELAVRLGYMKIPKGQVVSMSAVTKLRDDEVVVICTGAQGEPNSALRRMSNGEHRDIKLKEGDTAILSATPIPESGNDKLIGEMVDDLFKKNVHVFRHQTHDIDGIGPLHVSGHASSDEYGEMIALTRPKFFIPIYGPFRSKRYHIEKAIEMGVPRKNTVNADNGEVIALTPDKMEIIGEVPHGTVLVDQTGALVSSIVIKDRLLLAEEGLVAVILTIDKKTGQLLTSPDIISRGFIYMRDNEELMKEFRNELRRAVNQRFKRVEIDRFKQEIKEHVTHFLFEQTQRSPIVIPVVNIVGGKGDFKTVHSDGQPKSSEEIANEQKKRFEEMRSRLLTQDARTD
jgi:ribonuclease J